MTAATIEALPEFPDAFLTEDNVEITVRPLISSDEDALLSFFRKIPEEDRFYLKEDVTDPKIIRRWTSELDYYRVLPLVAVKDGRIIADGTLHHGRSGARRHIGEVRVVVDPEYRNRGVGRSLLSKLVETARRRGLEKLILEVVSETESAAKHTAQVLGFVPVAALPYHVQDQQGFARHLVILEMLLPESGAEDPYAF